MIRTFSSFFDAEQTAEPGNGSTIPWVRTAKAKVAAFDK
jgi:hypothetical protein